MNELKTGFFTSLWGVCRGTAIFPQLLGNSRSRAVWHLFLMSLLCTVLLSLRVFPWLRDEWDDVTDRYTEAFGGQLEFSAAGIRPEQDPDKPRSMVLPMAGNLIYTAREKSIDIPPGVLDASKYIIVWSNHFIAIVFRVDAENSTWDVQLMRPQRPIERRRVERDNLAGYFDDELKRPPTADEKWSVEDLQVKAKEVFDLCCVLNGTIWFIWSWLRNFLLGLICTGFFALLARLTGVSTARGLTGWKYWQIGVYAGFPGMLIATVIAAFDLFPGYGIAYMLALAIYWLPAAVACERDRDADRTPPPPAA